MTVLTQWSEVPAESSYEEMSSLHLVFLMMLKKTLEKKGARYIADTGGVALGVV